MHLTQYIKRLSDKAFLVAVVGAVALVAIVVVAGLVCFGFILSRWNIDNKFDYLSSFLEIIIALNASCSVDKVRNWIDAKRDAYISDYIVSMTNVANGRLTESMADSIQPLHASMQKIRMAIDGIAFRIGLVVAIVATLLLVVGFTEAMKPFAVVAAAPVLFLLSAIFVHNWLWKISYERLAIGPTGGVAPVDDKHDLSIVASCTGPVAQKPEEESTDERL